MPEEQNNQEEQQEQNNNQEQQVTQSPITSEDHVVTQSDLKRFYEAIKPYLNTVSIPNLDISENEEPVNAVITLLNNGNEVAQEPALNFKDFDISDDSENERTDIKPHRLSNAELQELSSDLPPAVNRMNTYSTEEQIVGTWIDGKPIYQKTIQLTGNGSDTDEYRNFSEFGINNVDLVIDYLGYRLDSNGGQTFFNYTGGGTWNIYIASKLQFVVAHYGDWARNQAITITWLYTKTTD